MFVDDIKLGRVLGGWRSNLLQRNHRELEKLTQSQSSRQANAKSNFWDGKTHAPGQAEADYMESSFVEEDQVV